MKTVQVEDETWKVLFKMKVDNDLESLDAVIQSLIARGKNWSLNFYLIHYFVQIAEQIKRLHVREIWTQDAFIAASNFARPIILSI